MARLARLALDGELHLVLQLGHGRTPVFRDDADRRDYLAALREAARREQVAVHGYALLDSEVRLLLTPASAAGLARCIQAVGRRYVAGYNRRHGSIGTLWAGRYRTALVDARSHFVDALVHVETAPQRAGLSADAADWVWSSARHHLGLLRDPAISEHTLFWSLGNTPFEREAAYRRRLEVGLPAELVGRVDEAVRKGWALGSAAFIGRLQGQTDRRLRPARRGRPRGGHVD